MIAFWLIVATLAGLGVMAAATRSRTKPAPRHRNLNSDIDIYETLRIMDEHHAETIRNCGCRGLYHECEVK